jgi:hypothetical protein
MTNLITYVCRICKNCSLKISYIVRFFYVTVLLIPAINPEYLKLSTENFKWHEVKIYSCLFHNFNKLKFRSVMNRRGLCWDGNASPLTGERFARNGISLSFQYDCKLRVTKFMARNNTGRGICMKRRK